MKNQSKKLQKVIDKYKNKEELNPNEFYILHKYLEELNPNYKKNVDDMFNDLLNK